VGGRSCRSSPRGGTNDKVAQALRNAMSRLHADTRTEAVATAIRNALID
jgi:DNA-binding NarL/FixJ family response regulator